MPPPLQRADDATLARIAKDERLTAGALVRAEKANVRELSNAIAHHTELLAGSLAMYDDPSPDDVHRAVHTTHHALEGALVATLLLGRGRARVAGRRALVGSLGLNALHLHTTSKPVDSLRAKAYGSSLATQWTTIVMALAASRVGQPERAIATAPARMKSRTERTGVTETANAFNAERADAAAEVIKYTGGGIDGVWSAILDRRTCAECWRRNGTLIAPRDPHPPLHSLCRCVVIYTRRS